VIELDHVIICCDAGAPEANALIAAGLVEGSSNVHAGQGTANRRFFFRNAYIELLFVTDLAAAKQEPARRTRVWERWLRRHEDACPFGVATRPSDPRAEALPPFPTWAYHAPYLPPGIAIGIALATPLSQPEFLHIAFATRPEAKRLEPLEHPAGIQFMTGVRIGLPSGSGAPTFAAKAVSSAGLVSFYKASAYVMELTFDNGASGRNFDLRASLPLVLRV
jgi:hypothetical protein